MKKFVVLVTCQSYSFKEIEVEANDKKEAKKKAISLSETGELEFTEIEAEYTVDKIDELPAKS